MIRINEDFLIAPGYGYSWTVYRDRHRTTTRKNGGTSDVYEPVAYCETLSKALTWLVNAARVTAIEEGDYNLKDALSAFVRVDHTVLEAIKGALPDMEVIAREVTI
jgi:hypothetical protein